jgi:hypothetical protein
MSKKDLASVTADLSALARMNADAAAGCPWGACAAGCRAGEGGHPVLAQQGTAE